MVMRKNCWFWYNWFCM